MLALLALLLFGCEHLRQSGAIVALMPFKYVPDEGIPSRLTPAWQALISPPKTPAARRKLFRMVDSTRVTRGQARRIAWELRRGLNQHPPGDSELYDVIDSISAYTWEPEARALLCDLAMQPCYAIKSRRMAVRSLAGVHCLNRAYPADSREIAVLRQYLLSSEAEDRLSALVGLRRPTLQVLETEVLDVLRRDRDHCVIQTFFATLNREPAPPLAYFPFALKAARSREPTVLYETGRLLFRYAVAEYHGERYGEDYRKQQPEYYRNGGLDPDQVALLQEAFQRLAAHPEFQYDAQCGLEFLDLIP